MSNSPNDSSNPYRPPIPLPRAVVKAAREERPDRPSALKPLGMAVAVLAGTLVLGRLLQGTSGRPGLLDSKTDITPLSWSGYGSAIVFGLLALLRGVKTGRGGAIVLGFLLAIFGGVIALLAMGNFSRGRQLRRRGRVLLPRVRHDASWAHSPPAIAPCDSMPAGVAGQWRENGRTEHASVAAFARLTLDLMALGAPPRLVATANQDALDEIRHTELCFGLARALDGVPESPAPFPEPQRARTLPRSRTLALSMLAVDSLIEGALHEGVSARIIAKLAQRCGQPSIRAVLKELAADEGRHTAHGWEVVEWCLDQGGAPVAHALLGALRFLPREMRANLPPEAATGAWEDWGIHGRALEDQEYQAARARVIERARALISDVRMAA